MANNGKQNELTTRQKRAITALLVAPDRKAAAEAAKVGYRSINRWLAEDPCFVSQLNQAETLMIADQVRALVRDMDANRETMRTIRDSERNSAADRLRAAKYLDDSLQRWRDYLNLETRIAELEAMIYDN
jgi:hypothetical protein